METQEQRQAQFSRAADIPEDEITLELRELMRTGFTAGITADQFKRILKLLEQRYIYESAVCVPGAAKGLGFFREGQNNLIRYLKMLSEKEAQ